MTDSDEFDVAVDGYFAIVPEWVIDADISDRAVRLYAVLRRHAGARLMARPSRAKLALRMRTSAKSVDRALRELETIGAVTIRHRWTNAKGTSYAFAKDADHLIPAPSGYGLHNSPKRGGMDTDVHTPMDTGDQRGMDSPDQTGRDTGDQRVGPPVGGGVGTPVTHERESLEPKPVKRVGPSASHTPEPVEKDRKRSAARLPADWQPTDAHRQVCAERGIDMEAEARKFRLHAEESDRRVVVWNSAFARWLENARPRLNNTNAGVSAGGRAWQD